jgi:hypothetical protein
MWEKEGKKTDVHKLESFPRLSLLWDGLYVVFNDGKSMKYEEYVTRKNQEIKENEEIRHRKHATI